MPHEATDPPELQSGFVTGINRLLVYFSGLAVGAASKGKRDWDVASYSIAAIVASAAAVEATVGEYLALPPNQAFFAGELDEWRRSLPRPYEIIKAIIKRHSGKEVGAMPWYDRMRCLFELRNHVVHYYPRIRQVGTFPEDLEPCIRKHIVEPAGDASMDWTSRLLVPEVASQAASIAQEAIHGFLEEVEGPRDGAA